MVFKNIFKVSYIAKIMNTGCKDLNNLFEYNNEIIMVYGPAGSGKTTLAKLAVIEQAKNNKKVVFIDTENGFSIKRLEQLYGKDCKSFLDNIILLKPNDLKEQKKIVRDLLQIHQEIGLIIVDTIGKFYRLELQKDNEKANRNMDNQLKNLSELTRKNIPVLLINQVYSNLNDQVINVGGQMLRNWSKSIIRLKKEPRVLILEKPVKKRMDFEIRESGIYKM